jgi:hypothetical protein
VKETKRWTEGTVSGRDEKQVQVTYYVANEKYQYWYHEDCDDIRLPSKGFFFRLPNSLFDLWSLYF